MKASHITELQAISQNTDSQSFPTSGTTMEYINKELCGGWGWVPSSQGIQRGVAQLETEVVESLQDGM